ncbi:3'-5' exonuclease [Streptomyces atratus]|uniref:3'-5' exonuclease n=1 Tax=Streptomyces atratus TaxID=1893 RepID=UPI00225B03B8|nr:3'-5' exonuclease [Streptomyces atratus]MCX5340073.1 hypothetical protein [Streptomyces atratus]
MHNPVEIASDTMHRINRMSERQRQDEAREFRQAMYRFKGLEYQRVISAGVSEGLVPRASVDQWERTDRTRHKRELHRARSLLFVAVTRARDALAILWNGEPSRFLTPLRAAVTDRNQ